MQANPEMENMRQKLLQAAGRRDNSVTSFLLSITDQAKDPAACSYCESISQSEGGHAPSQCRHKVHCHENVPAKNLLYGWTDCGQGIAGTSQVDKGIVDKVAGEQPAQHSPST